MGLFAKKFNAGTSADLADEVLVVRYRETGDKNLVGELFKRYTYPVIGVAYKYLQDRDDARDLVMQVFEKLLVDLREHEVADFKPWLFAVVRNAALMELRSRKSIRNREEGYWMHVAAEGESDGDDFVESQQDWHLSFQGNGLQTSIDPASHLENAILQLNDAQKRCVELFYLQKKSYQEVADSTGFSLKQVKSHLQNGKRNLRLILEQTMGNSSGDPP